MTVGRLLRRHQLYQNALRSNQTAETGQIHGVTIDKAVFFRRFDYFGDGLQPGIVHDEAEGVGADLSFADMFMTVDTAGKILFGVVQMNSKKVLEADRFVECRHRLFVSRPCAKIIAGGEDVRGVQAKTDPVAGADPLSHGVQVVEAPTQAGPLAGGGFKEKPTVSFREIGKYPVYPF